MSPIPKGGGASDFPFRFSTKQQDDESGLLYYGYRYYDPLTGRWPSRDSIGEQFLSGETNIFNFIKNSPISSIDVLGLMRMDEWAAGWKKRNPKSTQGMEKEARDKFRKDLGEVLKLGCIGMTCIELGIKTYPSLENCYKEKDQAERRKNDMESNKECCDKKNLNGDTSKARLFSVHFWNDKGKDDKTPDAEFDNKTGKANMDNWDYERQPGDQTTNFDFGYQDVDGSMTHANHGHDPKFPNDPMIVKKSTIDQWKKNNLDFNSEVWCVACEDDQLKK